MNKTIAILVPFMNSFGQKGFYQSQELGLAEAFYKCGWKVDVYKCISESSYVENIGFDVHYINVKKIGTHAIFKPEHIFSTKPDVLVCFSDTQLIITRLYNFCRESNILFIPYIGTIESVAFSNKIKKHVMDIVFKATTLRTYRKCKYLFCKNREVMKYFGEHGFDKNCLVLNPVGINLSLLNAKYQQQDRIDIREKEGYAPNDKVILFVGRLNPEKRPLDMFNILDILNKKEYRLIIIGDGELKPSVEEKLSCYGDSVRYYQRIKYDNMWRFYAIADYFVNLWDKEIFGMAILEAIYYLTPTFIISAPGPRMICDGMKSSFLCNSIEEISMKIDDYQYNLLDLQKDREKLITDFSWDRFVKNVEMLI